MKTLKAETQEELSKLRKEAVANGYIAISQLKTCGKYFAVVVAKE